LEAAEVYILAEANLGRWLKVTRKNRQGTRNDIHTRSREVPTAK
jgi:hypothetical protein